MAHRNIMFASIWLNILRMLTLPALLRELWTIMKFTLAPVLFLHAFSSLKFVKILVDKSDSFVHPVRFGKASVFEQYTCRVYQMRALWYRSGGHAGHVIR